MRKKIYLVILLFIYTTTGFAQDEKLIKKGDALFEQMKYFDALKVYEQCYSQNPEHAYTNYMIAKCYLATYPKQRAIDYASKAVKNTEKPTNDMYFVLAQACHINQQFDKAIEYYQKSDPGRANYKVISKYINECNFGKKYIASPTGAKVTNAGATVNTQYHEYIPYITTDMSVMYFTSRRLGSTGGKLAEDGTPYEDIYMAYNKGGAWSAPVNIGSPVNTDIHDACIGLSEDGQTMFVYRGSNGGDIYMSELKGKKWGNPQPVSFNTEMFETSACLSADGRTLYFVKATSFEANRDIYMCSRSVGGGWSKPIKVPTINTEYDEESPFLHPDGKTLYFSSKGHSSMGGYDVFKCTKVGSGWSTPVNLGSPINTPGDDLYFILTADGKAGFYSSDREGGQGKKDIYSVRMPIEAAPQLALMKGVVKDASTGLPVEATITITNNKSKEVVARFNSNSETGEYMVALPSGNNYAITIEDEGHLFYSENVYMSAAEGYKELKKDIPMVKAKTGSKVVLKNIFFDPSQAVLKPESMTELDRVVNLMKTNPAIRIEISGHTDNTGDATANMQLSQKRAEAVLTYLVSKGIDKTRLVAKGYGQTAPVATNDTPEGKQQNRRTEFKIL